MLQYASLFKKLSRWCYFTAITQFIIFLFLFLCISYLSTELNLKYDNSGTATFISKYEKYIVLATSLYMVVPFAFSAIFLFGLFHKHRGILLIFVVGSCVNAGVILITMIGSGIFLAVKGTPYVAYCLIGFGLALILLLLHGALLTLGIKHELKQNGVKNNNSEDTEDT